MFTKIKGKGFRLYEGVKNFICNKSGSEALEMVYSTFLLLVLILTTMGIIGYALQVNQVSYAAKRIARYVEISGQADTADLRVLLYELLPNADKVEAKVSIENANYLPMSGNKIQLREGFTVKVTANYYVNITSSAGGGGIRQAFPITVYVNGQSEIYWKT